MAQPQGIGDAWQPSDTDFMRAIPAFVRQQASVDPKRVYMSGISNGGGLTYWTACVASDVFHGFAVVSGYDMQTCDPPAPASLIHLPFARRPGWSPTRKASPPSNLGSRPTPARRGPTYVFGGDAGAPGDWCLFNSGSAWSLDACDASAPPTTCQTWDECGSGVEATFCIVPPDMVDNYAQTGGHILYINGTGLSLAAVAWGYFQKLP